MFARALAALAVLSVQGVASAQDDLLDRFAAAPAAWDVSLSEDGTKLAMGCSPNGLRTLCVIDLTGQEPTILYPAPVGSRIQDFYWANDRFLIVNVNFTMTMNGMNNGEPFPVYRAISFDTVEQSTSFLMTNYRNLTNTTNVVSLDLDDPEQVIMQVTFLMGDETVTGTNLQTQEDYQTHLLRVDLESGRARRYRSSGGSVIGYLVDPNGEVAGRMNYDDDTRRYTVLLGNTEVYADTLGADRPSVWLMDGGESVGLRFSTGDNEGLFRISRTTRQMEPIEIEGRAVQGAGPILDRWSGEVIGFRFYEGGLENQSFIDADVEGVRSALAGALGGARVTLASWSRDRRVFAFRTQAPGQPAAYHLYNRDSGEVNLIESEAPFLDGVALGSISSFSFTASDGLEIPGYLTLPPGHEAGTGPLPLIMMPHGGPAARDTAAFDWWAQYYASQGYAVAQVNFRGSGGLGAEFREAGYGGFGTRMIDDLADAAAWLESEGIAAPGGYCAVGASYGGYASLMLAIRDREAAGCVVAVNAVTEPISVFSRYSEANNDYWEQYLGSRFMSADESLGISPVRRASEIAAPVLMIWTDEDTTVPPEQSLALIRAMEDQGNVSGYIIPGEDHYLGATVARQQVLEQSANFLAEHHPAR